MKLKEACKIGKEMGLTTIGECVDNIDHLAMSMFRYKDIFKHLSEMYGDTLWDKKDISRKDSIEKILGEEDENNI